MKKFFRSLFMVYVICLATYVSYQKLMALRIGKQQVGRMEPLEFCHERTDWKYCVYEGVNTDPEVYLYYFHARGQNEKSWKQATSYPAMLQKYWQDKKYRFPKVVSVSFGPTWLATAKMSKPETGLEDRFRSEVFGTIEGNLGQPKKRFILGASMGGLNALTLAFSFPEHFSRVASLCPPLYTISPYSSWADVARFLGRTGAQPKALVTSLGVGRHFFSNNSEWNRFSPLERVKDVQFPKFVSYYISAGLKDEYGLYEGAELLANTLKERGVRTFWRPTSGEHCAVDIHSLGDFLHL